MTAVRSGERANAQAIPVPSSIRSVTMAAADSASAPGVVVELGRPGRLEAGGLGLPRELDVLALCWKLEQ